MTDLDHPDCQVGEVGSPAYFGTGDNPFRPRPFWRIVCFFLGHKWYWTSGNFTRCSRCKVKQ